jgi:hypothetical protein
MLLLVLSTLVQKLKVVVAVLLHTALVHYRLGPDWHELSVLSCRLVDRLVDLPCRVLSDYISLLLRLIRLLPMIAGAGEDSRRDSPRVESTVVDGLLPKLQVGCEPGCERCAGPRRDCTLARRASWCNNCS